MNESGVRIFGKLIQPSLAGGIGYVLLSVGLVAYFVVSAIFETGPFVDYLASVREHPTGIYEEYNIFKELINSSSFVGDASVFFIWAMVGLILYYAAVGAVAGITSLRHFLNHLSYQNDSYGVGWRDILIGLLIRLIALGGVALFIRYGLAMVASAIATLASATSILSWQGVLSIIAACLVAVGSLHLVCVLVRLFLLRTRIFFN